MELPAEDDGLALPNGLLSPALTPVTEEPPRRFNASPPECEERLPSSSLQDARPGPVPKHSRSRSKSFPAQGFSPHLPILQTFIGSSEVQTHGALKLSPAKISELASAPGSLPLRAISPVPEEPPLNNIQPSILSAIQDPGYTSELPDASTFTDKIYGGNSVAVSDKVAAKPELAKPNNILFEGNGNATLQRAARPSTGARSISVPFPSASKSSMPERVKPRRLQSKTNAIANDEKKPNSVVLPSHRSRTNSKSHSRTHSYEHVPQSKAQPAPLPALSIPTQLHLELSSERPPPLYASNTDSSHAPYESSKVKFERLLNFLLLPPRLEQVLFFGALTCLDAWLYTFTILPLRFVKALWILFRWFIGNIVFETTNLASFVYRGIGRLWSRHRQRDENVHKMPESQAANSYTHANAENLSGKQSISNGSVAGKPSLHRRIRASLARGRPRLHTKPSSLQAHHKADILEGLLIIFSCAFLMRLDASRMYHSIRGQAAIKLYVIYNVLEVFDRLFSALGQDIMECLFSAETLDRKPNGRSRIGRPFWMFLLALCYTVVHASAFFYQVITLNVAVNSYSNALLTLLMSNQFVEIKGAVFKKIEKENLFQLTCADVVERFQLWLMLFIIMLRNVVELGGLSVSSSDHSGSSNTNPTTGNTSTGVPFRTFGILPNSFTILPSLFPAHVLGPFLLVLGSEMLVDWLKHAYITKFNAMSHRVYERFLDVLAKDHYSSAFAEQGLVRRLGLPVIPLACLFIRATLQTYHMFLATNVSPPSFTTSTGLSTETEATASPVIGQIDHIFRSALGRSSFGGGATSTRPWSSILQAWTIDDAIALTTMLVVFLALYLVLLVFKLSLGMALLKFSKDRYTGMKERERRNYVQTETKRIGGWGAVELGDERRKIIYEGDPATLKIMRDREAKMKEHETKAKFGDKLDEVDRYSMVAKRIW